MADGSSYQIDIVAKATGVDASASQLESLASSIQASTAQATSFDNAIVAATSQLNTAQSATASAASAVNDAGMKYRELEVAANRAAKAADKAGLSGGDNSALVAKADAAKAALNAQGMALDDLKAKLNSATDAEKKHAASLKTIESASKAQLAQQAKEPEQIKKALGPIGEKMERLNAMKAVLGTSGMAAIGAGAAWLIAAAALAAVAAAAVEGYIALAKFAVTSNPKAMERINKATATFHKSLAGLFTGVRIEGFVASFEDFLSMFNEGESVAGGLKTLVSTMLNPLFDTAKAVGPYVKEMFKGMVYAALEATVAVLYVRNAIMRAIPASVRADIKALSAQIDWMKTAFYGGAIVAGVLAVALTALAAIVVGGALVAFALLLPMIIILSLPFVLLAVAIVAVIAVIGALGYATYVAIDYLTGLASAASGVAGDFVAGLVNGIVSGTGAFVAAVKNLAQSGINAAKSALGIASPSRVMMEVGSNTAKGMEVGVDEGGKDVARSMESLGAVPEAATGGAARAAGAIVLRFLMPDGSSQERSVSAGDELTLAFEDMAMQLGAT